MCSATKMIHGALVCRATRHWAPACGCCLPRLTSTASCRPGQAAPLSCRLLAAHLRWPPQPAQVAGPAHSASGPAIPSGSPAALSRTRPFTPCPAHALPRPTPAPPRPQPASQPCSPPDVHGPQVVLGCRLLNQAVRLPLHAERHAGAGADPQQRTLQPACGGEAAAHAAGRGAVREGGPSRLSRRPCLGLPV